MASNPEWCQPVERLGAAVPRLDAGERPGGGAGGLHLLRPARGRGCGGRWRRGLRASDPDRCPGLPSPPRPPRPRRRRAARSPLTVFGNSERLAREPHRGTVDLKGGGGLQLTGAARVHALALGLAETNTRRPLPSGGHARRLRRGRGPRDRRRLPAPPAAPSRPPARTASSADEPPTTGLSRQGASPTPTRSCCATRSGRSRRCRRACACGTRRISSSEASRSVAPRAAGGASADAGRSRRCSADDFVAIDLETTGLDARPGRRGSGRGRALPGRRAVGGYETLLNPGRSIPAASTRIHGITDDDGERGAAAGRGAGRARRPARRSRRRRPRCRLRSRPSLDGPPGPSAATASERRPLHDAARRRPSPRLGRT